MYFLLVLALLSTLVYVHLMLSDAINARVNPYDTGKDKDTAILISKIKYGFLIIMSLSWSGVIMLFK